MGEQLYSESNTLQLRDGKALLELAAKVFQWDDLDDQVIMDVGCGPGTNCPKLLINKYPKLRTIIAFDSNKKMIELAKTISYHPKIDYNCLDIQKDSFPPEWMNKISKIVSTYCLHWVKNQQKSFENIYKLLIPKGEAALIFTTTTTMWDCTQDFKKNPKWSETLGKLDDCVPESHYKKYDESHYRPLLEKIGFEIVLCESIKSIYKFSSDQHFADFITGVSAFSSYIPSSQFEDFRADWAKECKKCIGESREFSYTYMRILLKKPDSDAKS